MTFFFLPVEAESVVCAIHKFQRNTVYKKTSCINSTLQELIDRIAATKPINLPLLDIPKRKLRITASASSRFYDSSWLTDVDKFLEIVTHFEEIIANSQNIDFALKQSLSSVLIFAVVASVTSIHAKHNNEMLYLQRMIEKSLLIKEFFSATPPPNPDATPKVLPGNNSPSKTTLERWNQIVLG